MDFVRSVFLSLFHLRQSEIPTTHPMHSQTRDQAISLGRNQSQQRTFLRASMPTNEMEGKRQSTSARSRDSGFESMSEETIQPGRLSIFLIGLLMINYK